MFRGNVRRRRTRRARRPAATVKQRSPATYRQLESAFRTQFDSLADAGIVQMVLIDNSAIAGNKMIRVRKLKLEWTLMPQTAADIVLRVGVVRHTEGSPPADLDQNTVRDLRNENKLLRGPWMLPPCGDTHRTPFMYKPIRLSGLTLDANDDLSLVFENMTGASLPGAGPHLYALNKFWYSVVS